MELEMLEEDIEQEKVDVKKFVEDLIQKIDLMLCHTETMQ